MARRPTRKATPRTKTRKGRATRASARKAAAKGSRRAARSAAPGPKRTKSFGSPPKPNTRVGQRQKTPRLERVRRTLEDTVPTPPSSLNMDRRGSAVRTGRAELEENLREHRTMSPDLAAGDVDVNVENAYFTGEEAPGGDNPTPDQDIVDDIGKAVGVQYEDAEELKATDKVTERDKHRWELDPASSEDYKDRQ